MCLEKPQDQECGNCYFCITKTTKKLQGIFSTKEVEIEIFVCRRNPPTEFYADLSSQHGNIFAKENVEVPKTHWCGEWRLRLQK